MSTKICKICKQEKHVTEFHSDQKMKFNRGNRCKSCRSIESELHYKSTTMEYRIFHRAKSRAKRKGWEFNIELFDVVIPSMCPILKTDMSVPSIDRIDSSKGYIKGNIQVVSNRANMLKNNATVEELELILQHLKSECAV